MLVTTLDLGIPNTEQSDNPTKRVSFLDSFSLYPLGRPNSHEFCLDQASQMVGFGYFGLLLGEVL